MMAQAAHAATALQHLYADSPDMKRYLSGEDGRGYEVMRKAVLEVRSAAEPSFLSLPQVPDEKALRDLNEALGKANIPHHLWVEEP